MSKKTRLYRIWTNMKSRCANPNVAAFKNYGGRGITVCAEWRDSFEAFQDWATSSGYRDDLTLDRVNNNGNYEPSNCQWEDRVAQGNNSRRNRLIEHNGETHTISEWSRITGLSRDTIRLRIDRRGWDVGRALTEEAKR